MRLLTYNIHKGIGGRDRRYRFQRITDVIERQNPDVLCLQEVDRGTRRSRFQDQPSLLADSLCAETKLFQLNVRLKRGGYGNLLLSRWPATEHHHISLRLREKKPRGAQLAVIKTPEGLLQVVNWHLGLAEKERHWQVRRLLSHYLFRRLEDLPTIIAGDTNDWRNTLADGPFKEDGFRPVTTPISRFRTFPAYMPIGSLDKAFVRGPIHVRRARPVRTKLTRAASDHLPLVIDMHLAAK